MIGERKKAPSHQEQDPLLAPVYSGLPRGFHLEGVVEAVEVVEQAGDGGDFDDLALGEMPPDAGEKVVGDIVGIKGEGFGKFKGSLLARAEAAAVTVFQGLEFFFRCSQPPYQGGMRIQSIVAAVQVRNANSHQLFQLAIQVARGHDGEVMLRHGRHDCRPVRSSTKHVGDAAPFLDECIKGLASLRISLVRGDF